MKKDIEWLKGEIKDEEYNLKYVYDNFVPYEKVLIADDVYDLINQLDEPDEKTTGFANVTLDRYDELLKKEIIADWVIEEYKETLKKNKNGC